MKTSSNIALYVFLIISAVCLSSCRKDVQLELPEYTQKVVIEGSIETGEPALVFLSYSTPYFEDFDFSDPQQVFIKGARVVLSDGLQTDTLTEPAPSTGYLYVGTSIRGAEGRSYTLQVTVDGRSYQTSTTIHEPVPLDSLYFKGERDSLGFVWQRFTEPKGTGQAYRWMAKRIGRDQYYSAPFNSVFDDKFIDGTSFEFAYDRGRQPLDSSNVDFERGYYKRGDTVAVKFCRIGRREYEFWSSYYLNKSSNGNPFSAPINIRSMFNDQEHAMGAFIGYAPYFDTLVIGRK